MCGGSGRNQERRTVSSRLENATRIAGKGITQTIIEALERRGKRSALRAPRGKIRFELDFAATRR